MDNHSILEKRWIMVVAALFCCFLWGSAVPILKITYSELSVTNEYEKILIAGLRLLLGGAGILVFAGAKKVIKLKPSKKEWPFICIFVVSNLIAFSLFNIGLSYITGVKGAILTSTFPFFVVIYSHFMFKSDRLNIKKMIGLICGAVGIVIVNVSKLSQMTLSFSFAEAFIIFNIAISASQTVLVRKYAQRINIVRLNGWQFLLGGLLLLTAGYIGNPELLHFNAISIVLIIYLSGVTAVAFTFWFSLLRYHNSSKLAQYMFATPLFGTLMSVIIIPGEYLGIEAVIAVVFVMIGIIIVNRPEKAEAHAKISGKSDSTKDLSEKG